MILAGMYGEDPRLVDDTKDQALKASPPAQKYPRSEGVYVEWIAACKGGAPAMSSFSGHAAALTEMVLLGCLAVRMGQPLELNPQTGIVTNVTVPEGYLKPMYRQGWSL